jgi:hypothetical protein
MPVFFLQAENDHDLTLNRVLSEEVRKAGKPVETKSIPRLAPDRAKVTLSVCVARRFGVQTLSNFIETHFK